MLVRDLVTALLQLDQGSEVKISTDETVLAKFTEADSTAREMRFDGVICIAVREAK